MTRDTIRNTCVNFGLHGALISERTTIFYRAVVTSEVHVLQIQDPHFRTPLKLNQIVYFKVGHISTCRHESNAPKIVAVRPPDPEIVRSEL